MSKSSNSSIVIREIDVMDLGKIVQSLGFKADAKGRKPAHIWTDQHCDAVLGSICRTISQSANQFDKDHHKDLKEKLASARPRHERLRFVVTLTKERIGEEKLKMLSPTLAAFHS